MPRIDDLGIASLMRVVVTADPKAFSVEALSAPDQKVWPETVARWDFDVTPLRSGLRWLHLLASMRIKVEAKDEVVDLPSDESEVRVAVPAVRAVGKFYVKIGLALALCRACPTAGGLGSE